MTTELTRRVQASEPRRPEPRDHDSADPCEVEVKGPGVVKPVCEGAEIGGLLLHIYQERIGIHTILQSRHGFAMRSQ